MTLRPLLFAALFLALTGAGPAAGRTSFSLPASADPLQFYVFSLTDVPASEAAQDVVAGALGQELTVDPAVDGVVSFRTEGWSGSEALLNDFGTALLDQDIALMRTGPGAYTLTPSANIPLFLARGGVLMRLPAAATAGPPAPPAAVAPTVVETGRDRRWGSALTGLLIFAAGALAGGAALRAGQTVYRRAHERRMTPVLQLTDQRQPASAPTDDTRLDPDLIIPCFDARAVSRSDLVSTT